VTTKPTLQLKFGNNPKIRYKKPCTMKSVYYEHMLCMDTVFVAL